MSRLSREKMRESEIGETDVGGEIIDMSPSHLLAGNHLSGMCQDLETLWRGGFTRSNPGKEAAPPLSFWLTVVWHSYLFRFARAIIRFNWSPLGYHLFSLLTCSALLAANDLGSFSPA